MTGLKTNSQLIITQVYIKRISFLAVADLVVPYLNVLVIMGYNWKKSFIIDVTDIKLSGTVLCVPASCQQIKSW